MENEKEAGDKSDGVWWAVKQILRGKKNIAKSMWASERYLHRLEESLYVHSLHGISGFNCAIAC